MRLAVAWAPFAASCAFAAALLELVKADNCGFNFFGLSSVGKTTLERVLPYWADAIAPALGRGETLLIAAHGNSLRAIVKHLFAVPDEVIVGVEIPTGNPLLVELDPALTPVAARYLDEARAQPLPGACG